METLTKKTTTIEFEGRKYTLQDEITLDEFLSELGFPKNNTVSIKATKEGLKLALV